jgi:hypothetical protein
MAHFKKGFLDYLKSGQLSDVTLVTEHGQIRAHRIILAHSSEFFKLLLSSEFKEKRLAVVNLNFPDPSNVFPQVLQFIYQGKLSVTLDSVISLLTQADHYLIHHLATKCSEFVDKHLKRSTVVKLLVDAVNFNQERVVRKCLNFVASNFLHMNTWGIDYQWRGDSAATSANANKKEPLHDELADLNLLPPKTMLRLLTHPRLSVGNEWSLYQLVCRYISHNQQPLAAHPELVEPMMRTIRFRWFSYAQLEQACNNALVPRQVLLEACMARLAVREEVRRELDVPHLQPRVWRGVSFEYQPQSALSTAPIDWTQPCRGVLYWLGTDLGPIRPLTAPQVPANWTNPALSGRVRVAMSSTERGQPMRMVDWGWGPAGAPSATELELWTNDVPASWISVELVGYTVLPRVYSLRHGGNYRADALRNWDFQGSNDGKNWTMIKRHHNDDSLNGPFAVMSFPISVTRPFRWFRILQTGHNSSNHNFLVLSGIEIFGELWQISDENDIARIAQELVEQTM